MKTLFSYNHEHLKKRQWTSKISRDEKGIFHHHSSLGILATKAFHMNSEFNSNESLSFTSANKAFKYFLKFNRFWSHDPRNKLIHLTNDLSISNSRRWDNIQKEVFINHDDSNFVGFQLDIAIILTILQESILKETPNAIKQLTSKQFERLLEAVDNSHAYDSYLDIYRMKNEYEFYELIEDDFNIGLIVSQDHRLQLMIVINKN